VFNLAVLLIELLVEKLTVTWVGTIVGELANGVHEVEFADKPNRQLEEKLLD